MVLDYLGTMLGSYGLNVLDNSLLGKSAKQNKRALYIMPDISSQYNGISLTYNF